MRGLGQRVARAPVQPGQAPKRRPAAGGGRVGPRGHAASVSPLIGLPTYVFDRRLARRAAAGVHVPQVGPAARQAVARGHLDHRHLRQAIRRAAPRRENMQVPAGRQLQGAADEIAGRRGREDQALLRQAVARRQHAAAGYRHAATGTADGAGAGQSGAAADGPLATDGAGDIEAPAGDLAGAAEAAAVSWCPPC
ncbi:hypothetical protein G6F32_013905 [Rhizopus arrhizus]|nr:hypothetical protein G6F32_013905 [Rhizopus arrhizus]